MTRDLITSGPATGADVMANLNSHIERLWNAVALPLTSIGGTANALTATLSPPLLFGLVVGMKFSLTLPATNTAGVTLSINGATAVPVVDITGAALTAGAFVAGTRVLLEWDGAALRVLTGTAGAASAGLPQRIVFTTSGTLVKASLGSYPADHMVLVEAWGGGGGGASASNGGGGGGGGYNRREFRFADLPSSTTVSVGAGGAVNSAGGNSTFGALLTAYGGGFGNGNGGADRAGGGGGGTNEVGGNATSNIDGLGGFQGGGGRNSKDATGLFGGGGGGGGSTSPLNPGGRALFGGGGGAATNSGVAGGTSLWGGNGGNSGVAGAVRGGGGGRNAAGGRGEVVIWL